MWVVGLCLLAAAWADKLSPSQPSPVGAVGAGGEPGDLSAPPPLEGAASEVIPILSFSNTPNAGDGAYSFSYETGNGISAQEEGVQKEAPEGPGTAAQGVYSYTGPDGVVYTVVYTADENGFVPKGDHLPTPPPVPAEIQAALEAAAAEAATEGAAPGASATEGAVQGAAVPDAAPVTAAPTAAPQAFFYKTAPHYNYNYNNYNNQYTKQFGTRQYNRYFKRY